MADKHIIAGSAGYISKKGRLELGPVMRYGLRLTGKPVPKLCYIGTASGDAASSSAVFYSACIDEAVTPSHLQLFPMPNVADVRQHILAQDMIWVGGGSVANLLAVWRVHGLDEIMREAWEKGIVLSGVSAGSICWHTGGTTDSFGTDLQPVANGLGFLPYSNGVHYDTEKQRRPLLQKLIAEGVLDEGYATDNGAAIHYNGDQLHKIVADTPGKFAYHITKTKAGIREAKLKPELLA